LHVDKTKVAWPAACVVTQKVERMTQNDVELAFTKSIVYLINNKQYSG